MIAWPAVVERFRKVLDHGQILMVKGVIDREKEVIHVTVGYAVDMTERLNQLTTSDEKTGTLTRSHDSTRKKAKLKER